MMQLEIIVRICLWIFLESHQKSFFESIVSFIIFPFFRECNAQIEQSICRCL